MKGQDLLQNREIRQLIEMAIKEDIGPGDVTSESIFGKDHNSLAEIISKDTGIFCGGEIARLIYSVIDTGVNSEALVEDGDRISRGTRVMSFTGPTISLLKGERIVLNFLQRLCGIASETSKYTAALEGTRISILDTRKTLPGFRLLDKYAVTAGGGKNHRMGLFDMVMIKDNHIKAAGGITNAVNKIRAHHDNKYRIEVETTNLQEVREALDTGADIIMLDNMDKETIKKAVDIINGAAETEISGNVDIDKIINLRNLNVNYISTGALTHSVKAFDLSMKFIVL